MNNVLIYPFNREFIPILNNSSLLNQNNLNIVNLVTLPGWGLNGDIYEFMNSKLIVNSDYYYSLKECDMVWIIDSWLPLSFEKYIYPKIDIAIKNNKKVLITKDLTQLERIKVEKLNFGQNIYFIENFTPRLTGRLVEVNTPIIAVAGMSQNTNKFGLELSLKRKFENQGYKVLLIASRREANVLGEYFIPDFMQDNNLTENNKIIAFNHFVTKLESDIKPDIILLGIPGSVTSFDKKFFKDFGVLTFEISQSISIDALILCSLYSDYDNCYFDMCEQLVRKQYGIQIILHALSQYSVDESEIIESGKISFITLDEQIVGRKIKDISYSKLFNQYDEEELNSMIKILIDNLTSDSSIESI